MRKLQWYETWKIDENIEDEILEGINKLIKQNKEYKEKNKNNN